MLVLSPAFRVAARVGSRLRPLPGVFADREPAPGLSVGSEEASEAATFGGVSVESHADGKRRYRL